MVSIFSIPVVSCSLIIPQSVLQKSKILSKRTIQEKENPPTQWIRSHLALIGTGQQIFPMNSSKTWGLSVTSSNGTLKGTWTHLCSDCNSRFYCARICLKCTQEGSVRTEHSQQNLHTLFGWVWHFIHTFFVNPRTFLLTFFFFGALNAQFFWPGPRSSLRAHFSWRFPESVHIFDVTNRFKSSMQVIIILNRVMLHAFVLLWVGDNLGRGWVGRGRCWIESNEYCKSQLLSRELIHWFWRLYLGWMISNDLLQK